MAPASAPIAALLAVRRSGAATAYGSWWDMVYPVVWRDGSIRAATDCPSPGAFIAGSGCRSPVGGRGDQAQPQLKCVAPISRPRWMAVMSAPSLRSM